MVDSSTRKLPVDDPHPPGIRALVVGALRLRIQHDWQRRADCFSAVVPKLARHPVVQSGSWTAGRPFSVQSGMRIRQLFRRSHGGGSRAI